jgi:hypothetical protein
VVKTATLKVQRPPAVKVFSAIKYDNIDEDRKKHQRRSNTIAAKRSIKSDLGGKITIISLIIGSLFIDDF